MFRLFDRFSDEPDTLTRVLATQFREEAPYIAAARREALEYLGKRWVLAAQVVKKGVAL